MKKPSATRSPYSITLVVLVGTFVLACLMAYLVVKDGVNRTIERQALSVAEIVANQATIARTVYAREIAEKLRKDGFGPDVNSATMPGHVSIPAQFLKLVGRASSEGAAKLYEYKPVSKWKQRVSTQARFRLIPKLENTTVVRGPAAPR